MVMTGQNASFISNPMCTMKKQHRRWSMPKVVPPPNLWLVAGEMLPSLSQISAFFSHPRWLVLKSRINRVPPSYLRHHLSISAGIPHAYLIYSYAIHQSWCQMICLNRANSFDSAYKQWYPWSLLPRILIWVLSYKIWSASNAYTLRTERWRIQAACAPLWRHIQSMPQSCGCDHFVVRVVGTGRWTRDPPRCSVADQC